LEKDGNKVDCVIPFSSEIKFNLSIRQNPDDGNLILFMKGAPERIINRCSDIMINGKKTPLTPEMS
jgi:sodium/potassium-transporting ATPase subunit alpha